VLDDARERGLRQLPAVRPPDVKVCPSRIVLDVRRVPLRRVDDRRVLVGIRERHRIAERARLRELRDATGIAGAPVRAEPNLIESLQLDVRWCSRTADWALLRFERERLDAHR
jgi:hypothetical protein